eukprot:TRINITY_DN1386_c0_g1_i7.p1 TRINITY_DN1386_c0_g1~~TRINITY_DN1386_c0_g1_i7.p1  ORF type:complete len:247 (-),score=12.66 TRINITY_DN1386_c0_g1_i7:445-1185(-)
MKVPMELSRMADRTGTVVDSVAEVAEMQRAMGMRTASFRKSKKAIWSGYCLSRAPATQQAYLYVQRCRMASQACRIYGVGSRAQQKHFVQRSSSMPTKLPIQDLLEQRSASMPTKLPIQDLLEQTCATATLEPAQKASFVHLRGWQSNKRHSMLRCLQLALRLMPKCERTSSQWKHQVLNKVAAALYGDDDHVPSMLAADEALMVTERGSFLRTLATAVNGNKLSPFLRRIAAKLVNMSIWLTNTV